MAVLFFDEGRFDDAHACVERAKPHAADDHDAYLPGRAMKLQAQFWHGRNRLGEARPGALRAADAFERLGTTNDAEGARMLEEVGPGLVAFNKSDATVGSSKQCYLSCLLIARDQERLSDPVLASFFRLVQHLSPRLLFSSVVPVLSHTPTARAPSFILVPLLITLRILPYSMT